MRNTWKKAAAFTLALALVAGAAPANVGTGGLFGGSAIVANAATTVTTIEQLKNASGSVVIGADIEYSEYDFWYYEENNVDIDLNGHTITLAKAYFGVDNGHTLTIRDSKGDGKILMKRQVRVLNGNVILEGGTLESNYNSGAIGISAGTFTMNGGTITGPKSIQCLVDGSVIINGGNVNGEFNGTGTGLSITGGIFNFDVTSLVNAGVSVTKIGNLWYVGDSAPSIVDISTATVNLAADNSVESITVGDDTITDLSGFDITYGVSDTDHTATSVPSAAGTYYAYVTAKDTNTSYTGTAKSASFEVTSFDAFNASTETNPTLTFTEDFTGNVNITRDDGVIDLNGHTINGNLMIQNNDPDKTVTIKNGTVTGELDSLAAWNDFFKGKVVLENLTVGNTIWTDGHDYTIKSGTYNGIIYALKNSATSGNTTITGGTFNKSIATGFTDWGQNVAGGTFTISGGTFANEPNEAFVADGYTAYHKGDVWKVSKTVPYEKVDAVAATFDENGNTEYYIGSDGKYYVLNGEEYVEILEGSWLVPSTLNQFNASEETNPTLTLTEDVTGDILITRDDGIIDLNGHTINGNLFAQNNDPNKTLTIKNGVIDEFDPAYGFDMFFKGNIVFEDVTVNDNIWTDSHSITINSGTYYNINCYKQSASESASFTINGGTFNGKFTNGGTKMYHDHDGGSYNVIDNGKYDVTVTGGTFSFDPTEYVAEDYIVSNDDEFWTVAEKTDISVVTINYTNGNTFTQTGSDIDFAFTLTDLVEGTDYEVFEGDKNASQPGTYMVKVRGLGNYKGEMTIPWYIVPAAVTIKVNGTAVDGYEFGKSFTVTADAAPAGQKFSHWAVNNEPVCYSEEYSFIVKESIDLTAVYVADTAVVEAKPVLTLGEIKTVYDGKNAIGFEFTHTTPDSYTIEEVGLLYATNKLAGANTTDPKYANTVDLRTTDFDVVNAVKNNESGKVKSFVADYTNHNGTIFFSYAIGNNTDCYVYAVGYIKCRNANNEEVTLYTDFTAVTYNSIS